MVKSNHKNLLQVLKSRTLLPNFSAIAMKYATIGASQTRLYLSILEKHQVQLVVFYILYTVL
jgi:hypothetical protein